MISEIENINGINEVICKVEGLEDPKLQKAYFVKLEDDEQVYKYCEKNTKFIFYPDYDDGEHIIGIRK